MDGSQSRYLNNHNNGLRPSDSGAMPRPNTIDNGPGPTEDDKPHSIATENEPRLSLAPTPQPMTGDNGPWLSMTNGPRLSVAPEPQPNSSNNGPRLSKANGPRLSVAPEPHPKAVDGGWGWAVVFGSSMCHFFLLGLARTLGIVFILLREKFNASAKDTALVTAIFVALRSGGGTTSSRLFIAHNVLSRLCIAQ